MKSIRLTLIGRLPTLFLLLLLSLGQLSGCIKSEQEIRQEERQEEDRGAEDGEAGEERENRTVTLSMLKEEGPARDDLPAEKVSRRAEQMDDIFVRGMRQKRVFPTDFTIGSLQKRPAASEDIAEIIQVLDNFLSQLSDAEINEEFIHPAERRFLIRIIESSLEDTAPPDNFRLGSIGFITEGQAELNVKLWNKRGSAEGEIFIDKSGNQWYISDIQLDLSLLSTGRENDKKRFEPSTYRSITQTYY